MQCLHFGVAEQVISVMHTQKKKKIWTTKPLFLIYIQSNWYDTADETNHQTRVLMLWCLKGLYFCNKCPSLQGLYPEVKPKCFQSTWTFHSVGNSLLMGCQGIGVKGLLCPHPSQRCPIYPQKMCPLCMLWPRKWGPEQIVIRNISIFTECCERMQLPTPGSYMWTSILLPHLLCKRQEMIIFMMIIGGSRKLKSE